MSGSAYSQGSEEGEIRPKSRVVESKTPSGERGDLNNKRPMARRGGTSHWTNAGRGRIPSFSGRAKARDGDDRTLAEELQQREAYKNRSPLSSFRNRSHVNPEDESTDDDIISDKETTAAGHGPPPANMVTMSQEQRGISHHAKGSHSGGTEASPSSRTRNRAQAIKTPAATATSKDQYQAEADQIEAEQELGDPSYSAPSQDTATPSYAAEVDPQEPFDLLDADTDIRDPVETEDIRQVANAAKHLWHNQQNGERHRKKMVKEKYGVRHMPYENLKPPAQRERDDLIHVIQSNWPASPFWPENHAPKNSNGMTLEAKDVSTSLLTPVAELSALTRNDPEKAHTAMADAVMRRVKERGGQEKLLPEDAKAAIHICPLSRKRPRPTDRVQSPVSPRIPVRSLDQDCPAKRARSVDQAAPQGSSEDTVDSSATFGRQSKPTDAKKQTLENQHAIGEELDDVDDLDEDQQRTVTPLETERDTETEQRRRMPPPPLPEVVNGADDAMEMVSSTPQAPDDAQFLSQMWQMLNTEHPKPWSVRVPVESDWSANMEKLRGMFNVTIMKAKSMGRQELSIEFRIT